MININDARNYKKCQKKLYDIYVSKPPIGTVVINKLDGGTKMRPLGIDTDMLEKELYADYSATLQRIVSFAYSMLSE